MRINSLVQFFLIFFIICVRTRVIPSPHQPPTRGDATVLVAKVVLPILALPTAFPTGPGMKTNRAKVPPGSLSS